MAQLFYATGIMRQYSFLILIAQHQIDFSSYWKRTEFQEIDI